MISNIFKLVSVGNGQRGLFKKNESYCAIFDFSFILEFSDPYLKQHVESIRICVEDESRLKVEFKNIHILPF